MEIPIVKLTNLNSQNKQFAIFKHKFLDQFDDDGNPLKFGLTLPTELKKTPSM